MDFPSNLEMETIYLLRKNLDFLRTYFIRNYDMSRPFNCVAANVTEYIKTMAQAQELNVDEAEVRCPNQDDVCFGTIEVRRARLRELEFCGNHAT